MDERIKNIDEKNKNMDGRLKKWITMCQKF